MGDRRSAVTSGPLRSVVYSGTLHATPLHFHSLCEISLVTRGTGEVRVGSTVSRFRPGTLAFASPNCLHEWRPDGSTVDKAVCLFDLTSLDTVLSEDGLVGRLVGFGGVVQVAGGSDGRVRSLFRLLVDEHGLPQRLGAHSVVSGALLELVVEFLRLATPEEADETSDGLSRVIGYLHEHFTEPIDRVRIARALDLSPDALGRMFFDRCGVTIAQYLRRLRTDHAIALLHSTTLSAGEISAMSGFDTYRTFARALRALHSTSPSTYRRPESRHESSD